MVDDDLQRPIVGATSWLYADRALAPVGRCDRMWARDLAVLDQWVQLWAEAGKAAADDDSVVSGEAAAAGRARGRSRTSTQTS